MICPPVSADARLSGSAAGVEEGAFMARHCSSGTGEAPGRGGGSALAVGGILGLYTTVSWLKCRLLKAPG